MHVQVYTDRCNQLITLLLLGVCSRLRHASLPPLGTGPFPGHRRGKGPITHTRRPPGAGLRSRPVLRTIGRNGLPRHWGPPRDGR